MSDWPSDWLSDSLTDWLLDWMNDWQIDWLTDCLSVWLSEWPTDWHWLRLTDSLTDWLRLNERLNDCLTVPAGCVVHPPTDQRADRKTNREERHGDSWQTDRQQTKGPTNDWWLTEIVDNQETLVYLILNVALFKLLWWFCDRNCMREKIFIVKSRRDFAKAQGEDQIASLETTVFITNSKFLISQLYQ